MEKIIVLGGSGVGMIAASILDRIGKAQVIGFINDQVPVGTEIGEYKKIPVIGRTEDIGRFLEDEQVGVFNGFVGMTREKDVYELAKRMSIPDDRYVNIIDPTAIVPWDYCQIGQGVLCAPYSQVSPDATVSSNCMLLGSSFVGHDSFLDVQVSLATNAVVGANVHVGKAVHVGSNATVREKVRIGDFCLVGMGAVVLEDVPDNSIVVGNPARVLARP